MAATIILWSHALAALLFAGLALAQLRDGGVSVPRTAFLVALGLTALWALATAGIGSGDAVTWVAESIRNLGWLGFMFALVRRDPTARRDRAVKTITAASRWSHWSVPDWRYSKCRSRPISPRASPRCVCCSG